MAGDHLYGDAVWNRPVAVTCRQRHLVERFQCLGNLAWIHPSLVVTHGEIALAQEAPGRRQVAHAACGRLWWHARHVPRVIAQQNGRLAVRIEWGGDNDAGLPWLGR